MEKKNGLLKRSFQENMSKDMTCTSLSGVAGTIPITHGNSGNVLRRLTHSLSFNRNKTHVKCQSNHSDDADIAEFHKWTMYSFHIFPEKQFLVVLVRC